jgi:hypothetical protein
MIFMNFSCPRRWAVRPLEEPAIAYKEVPLPIDDANILTARFLGDQPRYGILNGCGHAAAREGV